MFECLLYGGCVVYCCTQKEMWSLFSTDTRQTKEHALATSHDGYHDGSKGVRCITEDLSKEATSTQRVEDEEAVTQRKEEEFSRDKEF